MSTAVCLFVLSFSDKSWVRGYGRLRKRNRQERKKEEGAKGKTVVANTKKAKVRTAREGGLMRAHHKGCGKVSKGRRKKTLYVRGSKNG